MGVDQSSHGSAIELYRPDVIQVADDTPVLLNQFLGIPTALADQQAGLRIVRIDDHVLSATSTTALPGVRIGEGDGIGYVFQREIDGALAFVADAGFSGIAAFRYTIADDFGDESTLVAAISVQSYGRSTPPIIAFADGSSTASVIEGVGQAILGALCLDAQVARPDLMLQVFEEGSEDRSQRFAVSGDKLRLLEPLNHATDGTVRLTIVAFDESHLVGSADLEIEVRAVESHIPGSPRLEPVPDASVLNAALPVPMQPPTDASGCDQFHFKPDSSPLPRGTGTETSKHDSGGTDQPPANLHIEATDVSAPIILEPIAEPIGDGAEPLFFGF